MQPIQITPKVDLTRYIVLIILSILLPAFPAVVAGNLNHQPGEHGDDEDILAAWTHLQVAIFAFLVYLYWAGPPNYLTAYTAIFIAFGLLMQQLGKPIGLWLARQFRDFSVTENWSWPTAAASYTHHAILGVLTWVAATTVVIVTKRRALPTSTESQHPEPNSEHD
jgi:hypothetical protein